MHRKSEFFLLIVLLVVVSRHSLLSVLLVVVSRLLKGVGICRLDEVAETVHKLDDLCCDIQAVLADLDWSMGQKGLDDSDVRLPRIFCSHEVFVLDLS